MGCFPTSADSFVSLALLSELAVWYSYKVRVTTMLGAFNVLSLLFILRVFLLGVLPLRLVGNGFIVFYLILWGVRFVIRSPPYPP